VKKAAANSGVFDVRVDMYIAQAPKFAQPVLTHLRELVHKASPEIEEPIKWSRPFFVHRGVVLGNMAAFTEHCSFRFWGQEMAVVLRADGSDGSEASGSFGRLTSLDDLPPAKVLLEYMRRAVVMAENGCGKSLRSPKERAKKGEAVAPAELVAALEAKPLAKANFAKLSPSCRREYIEWIVEARRPETRGRRIATTVEQVGEDKARHWKYAQVW
jgi:uncharacterized protein YdeI (YjbR/CyaY-like superfamily)